MTESWFVNGVSISNLAFILTDASGALTSPGRRGENLEVPGRHGRLRLPRKMYETNTLVLPLTVAGCLPDGSVPTGSTEMREFFKRVDELLRLFSAETVDLQHTQPDGSVRRIYGEVTKVLDFTRLGPAPVARVSVAIETWDPFWSDLASVTAGPLAFSTGGTQALTGFAGATAPMDELTVTFGPGSNPELTQPSSGYLLAYDGVIGTGQELRVDTAAWSVGPGAGTAWTPDVTKLRFGPESRFFSLQPEAGGVAPTVRVTHTGGGQVTVTISGKRRFLTG